jgi:hypothetical protein
MGMDVIGRNSDSPAGKYFTANLWSWRPIHDLIIHLCGDQLDDETLTRTSTRKCENPDLTPLDINFGMHIEAGCVHTELQIHAAKPRQRRRHVAGGQL